MTELERQHAEWKAVRARLYGGPPAAVRIPEPQPPQPEPVYVCPERAELAEGDVQAYRASEGKARRILREVADEHSVTVADIRDTGRTQRLSDIRKQVIRRLWAETLLSTTAIGKMVSREHSSVLHALCRTPKSKALAEREQEKRTPPPERQVKPWLITPFGGGIGHIAAKLTEADVIEIRAKHKTGMQIIAIAEEYGMGKSTISDIVRHKSWKHL